MTMDTCNKSRDRHRIRSRLLTGLAMGAVVFMNLSPLHAQSMDYGSLEQLFGEPVTTSATGSPQRATDVPANMTIVTADEIRRSGGRDLPSVLRHVGGVDVMQWAADNADVSIRGYDQAFASRTLVLIDGRQVYADYFGFIPWSALPVELSAIRQIEIVKGPNDALYGFNAVGGVINIITYNPRYDDVNTASVRTGTQGLAEVSGVATFKLGTVGALRLSGGLRSDREFTTPIPPTMVGPPRTANNRVALDANAVFALSDNVELGVEASHSHARQNELTTIYNFENSRFDTNSVKVLLSADTDLGLLKFTAYSNWISQRAATTSGVGFISFDNQIVVVQGEDTFNLGTDHTLRVALEYRHNTVNTTPFSGGRIFYDVVSASGMWNWRITPAVSLTNAVRVDRLALDRSGSTPADYPFTNADWNRTHTEASFNSGLVWKADERDTLRLIASHGVQLPNLANFGAFLLDQPYLRLTGTPTIGATTVTNIELAWDRDLPSIAAHLRASVFHQHTDAVVAAGGGMIWVPGGFYATPVNVGDSDANGLEINASGLFDDDWRWSLSYRAEFVKDSLFPWAANGTSYADFEHTTPKHVVKASLGWTLGAWEADAFLGYQSNTEGLQVSGCATALAPVGAYISFDGRIAYRLTDWAALAVSGQNLLQSPQRQTSGPAVERRVFATLSVNY
jgi:iron complex outermembrane receptor protein